MNTNTENLCDKAIADVEKIAQQYLDVGVDIGRVKDIIVNHMRQKMLKLYQEQEFLSLSSILTTLPRHDSKAEGIFHQLLEDEEIQFKFQYKVGPYRVDYLIGEDLAAELDGPHHNTQKQQKHDERKDKYLKKMGYRVLRVPTSLLTENSDKVLSEIKGLCPKCKEE